MQTPSTYILNEYLLYILDEYKKKITSPAGLSLSTTDS